MQRAFSAFPYGAPGAALLALRLAVAAQLLVRSATAVSASSWEPVIVVLMALTLTIGFATPFVSVLVIPASLLLSSLTGHWQGTGLIFECVHALILALLGPGAYSLDAKVYGRRIVEVGSKREAARDTKIDDQEP